MAGAVEVFVGRRNEVDALCASLDAASAGVGHLVLLAGEPGIGKTCTALQLTGHAAKHDARVLWGRCQEEAGAPPYWPWVQIIRALAIEREPDDLRTELDTGAGDIADLVPEIRMRLPDIESPAALNDPSGTRFRLFNSIARFLVNASRRQCLAIVLDDMHWADVPSLHLLEYLAMEMADSRLLVVGTYRETELSRRHRLSDTLGALARVPHAARFHLSGLNADDVRSFVAAAAGVTPPAWLTSAIHSQTEGNPLFVREVVRFLAHEGHFNDTGGANAASWSIRLPEGVREVIGRRLNSLSALCNEILATAAVIGRDFTLDVLTRASQPRNEEAVLEALDEAVAARTVEETDPGLYQFTHALVRITLYDELRTGQRRRLHRAVGGAIEAVHWRNPDPVLGDLAYHFRMSGLSADVERAIDYSVRAGKSADAALAFENAINFFQNALDLLDTSSDEDPERRCGLLLSLGDAQRKANDYSNSQETLRAAADMARSLQMWRAMAEAAHLHADTAWRLTAQLDAQSGQLLEEALARLPATETVLRIKLMGSLARDRLHTGRIDESKALSAQAIAMAREHGDPAALATGLAGMADFPWLPHETEEMLAQADEMAEMGARANDLEVAMWGHFRRVSLLLELGDIRAVAAAVETMGQINTRLRQPFYTLWELGVKATMALMRGDLDEAERLIIQTVRTQRSLPNRITDPVSLPIFTLRREQGRLRQLAPMVALFVHQSDKATIWRPGLALLYVELGDLAAARAVFDDLAVDDFAGIPRDGRWATCLSYLAEVCAAVDDPARASVLYRLLLPWAGRNVVMGGGTGCWGSSDRFLGLLATFRGHWLDAERHFTNAIDMNKRVDAFAQVAHTDFDFAGMLLRRGYPGDMARAAAHLIEAKERCTSLGLTFLAEQVAAKQNQIGTPAPKPVSPDNLTPRELEVLRLLAIGRGNADIGLVLDIGQSTVATHVHNILAKTGCANRTEAAAYAVRHGLQVS
jgi:DNA-binding CsgD family transcriptional regulator/tetratricopeptide (TPR) repeat protein